MSASDAEMIMLRVTKYKTSILNFKLCAKTLCIHMAYKIGIYDSLKSNQCVMKMACKKLKHGFFAPDVMRHVCTWPVSGCLGPNPTLISS